MKAIFRDNEGIVNFLKEYVMFKKRKKIPTCLLPINRAAEEHEPLLQAYAKKILYHTGQRSLGRQLSASTELVRQLNFINYYPSRPSFSSHCS